MLAVGISMDGHREVLGSWIGDSESDVSWGDVFSDLKGRGLSGVKYIVSDAHKGLLNALDRHFSGVRWQRCQVHFIREIVKRLSKKDRPYVIDRLKSITACTSRDDATRQMETVINELEDKFPNIANQLEDHGHEILTVYNLPEAVRKKMRTTNMIERLNQEIKRRTRVVRIFPDQQSCLMLVSALVIEQNEEWMGRRYLTFDGEVTILEREDKQAA